ncbi:MAG: hypothetical protein DWQ01_15060 [Planctomycetota bacterium]|nr:MAG: hypothetical protein DWQ01_15060 [Planctomycetota bacterium]
MTVTPFLGLFLCFSSHFLSPPPQNPSSETQVRLRILGAEKGLGLGTSLAWLGDWDQDGHPDLLLGSPEADVAGARSGMVQIASGKTGKVLAELRGENSQERFGQAVAGLGDINGDGRPDFAIGVPGRIGTGPAAGEVLIYSGTPDLEVLHRWKGQQPREEFGIRLATISDLSGDGRPDLLVAATGAISKGAPVGKVFVYDPASGRMLRYQRGDQPRGGFGFGLADAGDVDGDGRADLIVGAPAARASGPRSGRAYIYSGIDGHLIRELRGPAPGAEFGCAVSGVGDLDGDGKAEVAVGSWLEGKDFPNAGSVRVFSGASGEEIVALHGKVAHGFLGQSLAGPLDWNRDGRGDLLIGAPGQSGSGKELGRVQIVSLTDGQILQEWIGSGSGARAGAAVAAGGDGAAAWGEPGYGDRHAGRGKVSVAGGEIKKAAGPALATNSTETVETPTKNPTFWLKSLAQERDWRTVEDVHGRWILFSSMDTEKIGEAAAQLRHLFARLDASLGGAEFGNSKARGPLHLLYVDNRKDVRVTMDTMAETFPYLADWAKSVQKFARIRHWNPMLAIVRHDRSTKYIPRPEIQLAHEAVHLELGRRFGRLPAWIPEALSYAVQDELAGGVYGYSNHPGGKLSEDYHQQWRAGAAGAVQAHPSSATAFTKETQAFQQDCAYLQFAIGHWWMWSETLRLQAFLKDLAKERPGDLAIEKEWIPDPATQEKLLDRHFGSNWIANAAKHWSGLSTAAGPTSVEAAVLDQITALVDDHRLSTYRNKDGRLQLYSDFRDKDAREALNLSEKVLAHLDRAFGKVKKSEIGSAHQAFMLKIGQNYTALLNCISESDPKLRSFMKTSADTAGFTIYRPRVTSYFHDTRFQEEAKPVNSLAHNLVHLEMHRRFGPLPLWLLEGLACAGEEATTGEVWANWNRSGFVYAVSHGAWRNTAKRMVEKNKVPIQALYSYSARPFDEELAHLAFAFATYGLEGNRKGLNRFAALLSAEYKENWAHLGRFEPSADLVEKLVLKAFGKDFENKFRTWWGNQ